MLNYNLQFCVYFHHSNPVFLYDCSWLLVSVWFHTSAWWSGWCSASRQYSTWPALQEERLHRGSRVWEGRHQPAFPGTPARTEPRPPALSTASASRPSITGKWDVTVAQGLDNFIQLTNRGGLFRLWTSSFLEVTTSLSKLCVCVLYVCVRALAQDPPNKP